MQLYAGMTKQFVEDTTLNRIAEKLSEEFFRCYRYKPSPGEVNAWRNSLQAVSNVVQYANFLDHGIILEYQLPLSSKRLDCMFTATDGSSEPNAVVMELKQWDRAKDSDVDGCVTAFVGGREREVLHPSRQVGQYHQYLADCHTVFSERSVALSSCSYLHNAQFDPGDVLFAPKFEPVLKQYPLFAGDQRDELIGFLEQRLRNGNGRDVLNFVLGSKYRPCKNLLDHVAQVIEDQSDFVLLDEQLVVFNAVLSLVKQGYHEKSKVVVLVKGGPGTGKSIIALHLVGALSKMGYNAQHGTGSRAFTNNIHRILGNRAKNQFRQFSNFALAKRNEVDVLVCDEAHRLWPKARIRYHPLPDGRLIDQLIEAAKVTVFFIDDLQGVRPSEVGSSALIREAAKSNHARLLEYELEAQFRCQGSEAFINWIDNTLGTRQTANVIWAADETFDFRVVDSPATLEALIRKRQSDGYTARLSAGFCWPWSREPRADGTLEPDVRIGNWAMPWNARPDGKLAKGIPKSHYWASDPNGINQVGCVYTAQGFEYDCAGVIFGTDLRYDCDSQNWVGDPKASHDPELKKTKGKFVDLVKQTYRVLLTRGMKSCYVYFMDKQTQDFFRSRMADPTIHQTA